jgi:hypothetical protein
VMVICETSFSKVNSTAADLQRRRSPTFIFGVLDRTRKVHNELLHRVRG